MKLTGAAAERFLSRPDPAAGAVLIYGQDADRVARRRTEIANRIAGAQAEADMRLTRLAGAELRKDPAALMDALKAVGFFPGQRLVIVEEATDSLHSAIAAALDEQSPDDAFLIVTAGNLTPRSGLRKLFEGHKRALCLPVYRDPPSRAEIERALTQAGLTALPAEALRDLSQLAQELEPGDFDQTLEKLALYKLDDPSPVTGQDIQACAPATTETSLDDALGLVIRSETGTLAQMFARLAAQGATPVSICIAAQRLFRTLLILVSHPDGPEAAMSRVRPPIFGPRRAMMTEAARRWTPRAVEEALSLLMETDMTLRSSAPVPAAAIMERTLIRIAMLGRRGGKGAGGSGRTVR